MRAWYERKTETADWRPRYRSKVDALIRIYIEGQETRVSSHSPQSKKAIADLGDKPVGAVTRSDVMRVADGIKRGSAEQFMAIGKQLLQRHLRPRASKW